MDDSIDLPSALTGGVEMPSYRPDAKERRYDRQLRLWASSGQRSLEQANILLIGCDATGSQALKNLVLPGISSFTVCSHRLASPKDVATNFFLQASSIGQPIAPEVVRHLCELNPSVQGVADTRAIDELLSDDPNFFLSFSLILVCNASPNVERRVADLLWHEASSGPGGRDIPLVAIRNSGFIGRLEIQLKEHWVNDTHPESTHTLRVGTPFAALADHAQSLDLSSLDSMAHSHVPWVVLLVKASIAWKEKHGGMMPRDLVNDDGVNEQQAFKQMLSSMRRKADEENFDEAVAQAYQVWADSGMSTELRELLDDEATRSVSKSSSNMRILLAALRAYLRDHDLPPISATLPDMHSSTESYITLQNLYRRQAERDLGDFQAHLSGVLAGIGLGPDAIDQGEVVTFVKNTSAVAVVRGSAISDRRSIKGGLKDSCAGGYGLDDWPTTLGVPLHLGLLAAERFHIKNSRWPGQCADDSFEPDVEETSAQLRHVVEESGLSVSEVPDELYQCVREIVRGGSSTLPNTAALLGGLAAQEAIKLVTSQYAPLDNTCIVDLVHSTTTQLRI